MHLFSKNGPCRRNVDSIAAHTTVRRIPLSDFFPALGSKHGIIFLGFVKCPKNEELIVSIDELSLRFHTFCPFRAGPCIVGSEVFRLQLIKGELDGDINGFGGLSGLLIHNYTVLVGGDIVVSVIDSKLSSQSAVVIHQGPKLVQSITHSFKTADHCLYRSDYLDYESDLLVTYRTSRVSITVTFSVNATERVGSSPIGVAWEFEGASWLTVGDNSETDGAKFIKTWNFNGLEFAQKYVSVHYSGYFVHESRHALAVSGPPEVHLRRVPIVLYIPLESHNSERKKRHLILILILELSAGHLMVKSTLDAEVIYAGSERMEFAGFCTSKGLKYSLPCTAYYCRDKLSEDNPVHVAKESYCTMLSNFTASHNTESWYMEIEHPSLPIVVYNDEVYRDTL